MPFIYTVVYYHSRCRIANYIKETNCQNNINYPQCICEEKITTVKELKSNQKKSDKAHSMGACKFRCNIFAIILLKIIS